MFIPLESGADPNDRLVGQLPPICKRGQRALDPGSRLSRFIHAWRWSLGMACTRYKRLPRVAAVAAWARCEATHFVPTERTRELMGRIVHRSLQVLQRWQLCLLLCVYALAALLPGPGLRIREVSAGSVPWFHGGSVRLSLPSMMRAFLLLNAGFGTHVQELGHLGTRLRCLGFGLAASVLGPILFAFVASLVLINLVDLLLLNYSNASSALPQPLGHPDWSFLVISFLSTTSVCVLSFGLGRLVVRWARADSTDELSLMFGLRMSNTGTTLVLALAALPEHPEVIVPIVFYTLVQQITAGVVDARSRSLAVKR